MNVKTKRALLITSILAATGGTAYYVSRKPKYSGIKLKKSIVIDRPASELYDFWHDFKNLSLITNLLKSMEVLDVTRSRWTAAAPGDISIHWEADITKDVRNEMIAWRSLEDSPIETAGYVRFEPAYDEGGTWVRVAMEYNLPAGKIGDALAALFGKRPGTHVEEMLRRFKQLMESRAGTASERSVS